MKRSILGLFNQDPFKSRRLTSSRVVSVVINLSTFVIRKLSSPI